MSLESRRVHFPESPVTRAYSPGPGPRTPSPSWSDNSLPDNESGPSTPPSTSSFATKSLPHTHEYAKSKPKAVAHPLLEYNMYAQMTPLAWDASTPPSRAALRKSRKGKSNDMSPLSPSDLVCAATHPSLPYMEIRVGKLGGWKPVRISKVGSPTSSPSGPPSPVTVKDVLEGVHDYLTLRVGAGEYAAFPPALQDASSRSFYNRWERVKRSGDAVEAERVQKAGMLRMDVMCGETNYFAFTPVAGEAEHVWQMHFSRSS